MALYTVENLTKEIDARGEADGMANLLDAPQIWGSGAFTEMMRQASFFGPLAAPPLVLTYGDGDKPKVVKIKLLFRQNFVFANTLSNHFVAASKPNRVLLYNVTFYYNSVVAREGRYFFIDFQVLPDTFPVGKALLLNREEVMIFDDKNVYNKVPIWPGPVPSMYPFIPRIEG